jgi:hypothetical protein
VIVSCEYCPSIAARWRGENLRRHAGMRYALLNPVLGELARDGRIKISGEMVSILY